MVNPGYQVPHGQPVANNETPLSLILVENVNLEANYFVFIGNAYEKQVANRRKILQDLIESTQWTFSDSHYVSDASDAVPI